MRKQSNKRRLKGNKRRRKSFDGRAYLRLNASRYFAFDESNEMRNLSSNVVGLEKILVHLRGRIINSVVPGTRRGG